VGPAPPGPTTLLDVNTDWALKQLSEFLRLLEYKDRPGMFAYDPYRFDREWTIRCIETIRRDAEIRENLGEDAPDLNAGSMHPWIWQGARSLWQSGHFAEAVEAAAKKLNAETTTHVQAAGNDSN
jgi:hypothetical protein